MPDKKESPIKSGWRGNLNGCIKNTNSTITVSKINIEFDYETAWAICTLLHGDINKYNYLTQSQAEGVSNIGAALGRLIDHPSANNGGRDIIK